MITFIVWLRCLAALLITNSHYTGIYPIDVIANGGLIGDIVFFAVSGYCLTNIKTGFFKWYGKRLARILPPVLLITAVFALIGAYSFGNYANETESTFLFSLLQGIGLEYPKLLSWLIYPTYYHFVASILVLYIPYYFLIKCIYTRNHIPVVMAIIAAIYLVIYLFFYDKSYYHIDTVREPFCRFLFMESMLLGAYFRINDQRLRNKGKPFIYAICTAFAFALYFASKLLFSKDALSYLQIVNQLVIFVLLYFLFRWFASIDAKLDSFPKWSHATVKFIANLTLEIYLVQYVLIDFVRKLSLPFPINWILLTAMIIAAAFILHIIIKYATKAVEAVISKLKKPEK